MNPAFEELAGELDRAWSRSDALFALLRDDAWGRRPIPLRHPFVFYLGHLPAFAWNQLGAGVLGAAPVDAAFEDLFERGIDPDTEVAVASRPAWPPVERVAAYRDDVRHAVRDAVGELDRRAGGDAEGPEGAALAAVLEHELMHHETLLYMLAELDGAQRRPLPTPPVGAPPDAPAARSETLTIPDGVVRLGAPRGAPGFTWDNESPAHDVELPAFSIDALPVTNAELLAFIDAGGYADARWWTADDAAWRRRVGDDHPHGWSRVTDGSDPGAWTLSTLAGPRPLADLLEHPARVTHAEACAFARWRGRRLPTEAEWQRAAHGTPDGGTRPHPWGDAPFTARHGNADLAHWGTTPVGRHPDGASAFGLHDTIGQGWEWTASPFEPFQGFEVTLPHYPGYSTDFFGEGHVVLLGGSWATDARLLRRSFRNWFRPHYPYAFAGFRLAG